VTWLRHKAYATKHMQLVMLPVGKATLRPTRRLWSRSCTYERMAMQPAAHTLSFSCHWRVRVSKVESAAQVSRAALLCLTKCKLGAMTNSMT